MLNVFTHIHTTFNPDESASTTFSHINVPDARPLVLAFYAFAQPRCVKCKSQVLMEESDNIFTSEEDACLLAFKNALEEICRLKIRKMLRK